MAVFEGREGPVRVTGLALLTTRLEWKAKKKKDEKRRAVK
jgi:hypothetical protein